MYMCDTTKTYLMCHDVHTTGGGDQTLNHYDCQNFKQLLTGVPVTFKQVFTGVPRISNKFSQKSGQGNCPIWRSKYLKSDLPLEQCV